MPAFITVGHPLDDGPIFCAQREGCFSEKDDIKRKAEVKKAEVKKKAEIKKDHIKRKAEVKKAAGAKEAF